MTIAALITEGIGPGGSIKFVLTGGLDLGAAPSPTPTPTPIPPSPVVQAIFPHDDYDDDYRPWWNRPRGESERRELRLRRMREEIGLLPPAQEIETPSEIPTAAEKEVAKAVEAIIAKPEVMRSETKAFDLVKSFESHFLSEYQKALLAALARDARLAHELSVKKQRELAEFAWREEVSIKLAEKMEQVLADHARRDEEEEYLIGFWLM